MPTLANSKVLPPKGWDEFEDIVCSAAKNRWHNQDFTRHGCQGQRQEGVDVYGKDDRGQIIGLQCKNTLSGVSKRTLVDEIQKAESFQPSLTKLYIATTAPTDKTTQEYVRTLSKQRQAEGKFEVEILFWNDICQDLTLDSERLYQHYPHLRPAVSATQQEPSHDLRLFQEFQAIFPYEPAVRLLKEHDFGGPFPCNAIQPLFAFVETWDQPEKVFLDQEIQSALADLHRAAREMANHLAERTAPIGNGDYASVFSDTLRAAGARPPWVIDDARVLNAQANLFVPLYEQFVRLCRSKLFR